MACVRTGTRPLSLSLSLSLSLKVCPGNKTAIY